MSSANKTLQLWSSLDGKGEVGPERWTGKVDHQAGHGSTILIRPAHERGGNSRGRRLRVRPGESFSWRKKWCASHQPASRRPASFPLPFPLILQMKTKFAGLKLQRGRRTAFTRHCLLSRAGWQQSCRRNSRMANSGSLIDAGFKGGQPVDLCSSDPGHT